MHQKVFLLGLLVLTLTSCSAERGVVGSGNVQTETRSVSGIQEVRLMDMGDLTIIQTGSESLTVEAENNLLPYLGTEQIGNRLLIQLHQMDVFAVQPTKRIHYILTVKDLRVVESDSNGAVEIRGFSGPALRVRLSGTGDLTINGQTDSQDVEVSGSGSYVATAFTSKRATIEINDTGSADIQVSTKLTAWVNGSGYVRYQGRPTVEQHITGMGQVTQR